jgi:hypothetical protein
MGNMCKWPAALLRFPSSSASASAMRMTSCCLLSRLPAGRVRSKRGSCCHIKVVHTRARARTLARLHGRTLARSHARMHAHTSALQGSLLHTRTRTHTHTHTTHTNTHLNAAWRDVLNGEQSLISVMTTLLFKLTTSTRSRAHTNTHTHTHTHTHTKRNELRCIRACCYVDIWIEG